MGGVGAADEAWARRRGPGGVGPSSSKSPEALRIAVYSVFPATSGVSGELAATGRAYTAVQTAVPAPPGATMEAVPSARVTGAVQC
ncbi:hypothetical protein SRABI26_01935 [Arthrobacter sp. Bi26]|nr:hypothetical protein SRABI26_01935 [Arthrobacter sp. Bi26]